MHLLRLRQPVLVYNKRVCHGAPPARQWSYRALVQAPEQYLRTKTVVSATEVTGAGGLSMLFSSLTFLVGFCFSSYLSLGALATNLIVDHRENAVDESLTFSVGLERASIFPE
jgi:hypothetical protein